MQDNNDINIKNVILLVLEYNQLRVTMTFPLLISFDIQASYPFSVKPITHINILFPPTNLSFLIHT